LRYSDIAWNPTEGFQIITAIADDSKPLLQVWDLRKSTTAPFKELQGHTRAVLNIAWNANDTNILASCGEDGKTLVWDLFLGQPIFEVETPQQQRLPGADGAAPAALTNGGGGAMGAMDAASVFGGGGGGGQQQPQMSANELFSFGDSTPRALTGEGDRRNNSVEWAPHVPGLLACCTFDRKVHIFSLHGIGGQKPPKYMRRPAGASFAFGGRLTSFVCGDRAQVRRNVLSFPSESDGCRGLREPWSA
jgi:protein transport protein SEC31